MLFMPLITRGVWNTVNYTINLLDWNQNPANPNWGVSTETVLTGQAVYYIMGPGNLEVLQHGTQPGELIIFKNRIAQLTENPGGAQYPNSTVTITAIIQ